jgi:hypothetical protein
LKALSHVKIPIEGHTQHHRAVQPVNTLWSDNLISKNCLAEYKSGTCRINVVASEKASYLSLLRLQQSDTHCCSLKLPLGSNGEIWT